MTAPAESATTFDWMVCLDGGVSDRYASEAEALADLPNHPAGSTVEHETAA